MPAPDDLTDETTITDEDADGPEALSTSLLNWKTLVSFVIAIVVFVLVFRAANIDFRTAFAELKTANPIFFAAALVAYYVSFAVRGVRWKGMLGTAGINESTGHQMPNTMGMFEIITLSWFANSVLPARLGDAYRCFLIKKRANASFGVSLGTILAERLIDLVVLVGVLLFSGLIVYGSHAPDRARQSFFVGGIVVVLGVIGVVVLWVVRDRIEAFMPTRVVRHYRKVRDGLFLSLGKPMMPILVSVLLWVFDGLRLFLVAWSLGQHIPFQAAVMVALLSALISTIPITPAGLGFVEGIMIYALTTIGVKSSTAAAIALLDRFVTYGSLLIIGGVIYLWVLRKDLRPDYAHSN